MKKTLLFCSCLLSVLFGWAEPYPKESMSELKHQAQQAWNRGENIESYMDKIRLKGLQLTQEISLLNDEDVRYDMKLLTSGENYQIALGNCEQNLFKSGCDYEAIGNKRLTRCLEHKSNGKLVRVGYCRQSADGLVPVYRASAHDVELWNYIDNSVKRAYQTYKKGMKEYEDKKKQIEKNREEERKILDEKVEAYNANPNQAVLTLTRLKKYNGKGSSKGSCNEVKQIDILETISYSIDSLDEYTLVKKPQFKVKPDNVGEKCKVDEQRFNLVVRDVMGKKVEEPYNSCSDIIVSEGKLQCGHKLKCEGKKDDSDPWGGNSIQTDCGIETNVAYFREGVREYNFYSYTIEIKHAPESQKKYQEVVGFMQELNKREKARRAH